jgi:Mg-chelatase subunit ChlD
MKPRVGSIVVYAAFALVVALALVAFAVDVGYMMVVRTDLQTAADAAALAGAADLAKGTTTATNTALTFASQNVPAPLQRAQTVVTPGRWDKPSRALLANTGPIDALQVQVTHTDTPLFFGGIMGRRFFDAEARATALLRPRDIALVLDFSGSMNTQRRIDQLKAACDLFFTILKQSGNQDRVALVRYATDAQVQIPLTSDFDRINSVVQATQANGWTNIGDGMMLGRTELETNARPTAFKMMVIMTDGHVNRPANRDPRQYVLDEAQRAAAAGILLVTLSFGTDADKSLMMDVAAYCPGGVAFNVAGDLTQQEADLQAVFRKIATFRPVVLVD